MKCFLGYALVILFLSGEASATLNIKTVKLQSKRVIVQMGRVGELQVGSVVRATNSQRKSCQITILKTSGLLALGDMSNCPFAGELRAGQTLYGGKKNSDAVRASKFSSSDAFYQKDGIKGVLGLVTGLGATSALAVFGADYVHSFTGSFIILGGVTYWSWGDSNASISDLSIDGGAGYNIPVSQSSSVEFGGRLGLSIFTLTISGLSSTFGSASFSGNYFTITPYGAFNYALGSTSVIGAEIRKPIYLSSAVSTLSGLYIMAFYKYGF